jgi:hypothetical protein
MCGALLELLWCFVQDEAINYTTVNGGVGTDSNRDSTISDIQDEENRSPPGRSGLP